VPYICEKLKNCYGLKYFYTRCLIAHIATILVLLMCVEQKAFIDELKRALAQHSHRALTEGAAVTCVKLCKSATYVNITDRANVLFVLVHTINHDLKVS
jgi:hypothetical protein